MRRVLLPLKLFIVLALAACVTVNVYFPAAAAEKAADQIIDTVTGQQGTPKPQSSTEQRPPNTSRTAPKTAEDSMLLVALGRTLELLVPAAHAQANLDISTPEIRAVTSSMQSRFGELKKYFDSGVLGLTADGLIEVRDQNAVPLAERAAVKRLVSEDNKDRATLYTEIAKANGHPEGEPEIRRIFARRWVERGAQPGWFYQDGDGSWKKK